MLKRLVVLLALFLFATLAGKASSPPDAIQLNTKINRSTLTTAIVVPVKV